jgi:hypothetical protein
VDLHPWALLLDTFVLARGRWSSPFCVGSTRRARHWQASYLSCDRSRLRLRISQPRQFPQLVTSHNQSESHAQQRQYRGRAKLAIEKNSTANTQDKRRDN